MNEKTKIPLKVVFVLFSYLNFTIFYKVEAIKTSLTIALRALVNKIILIYFKKLLNVEMNNLIIDWQA